MNDKSITNFLHKYRAKGRQSTLRVPQPVSYNFSDFSKDYYQPYIHVEEVPAAEITISIKDLEDVIDKVERLENLERMCGPNAVNTLYESQHVISKFAREQRIRNNNPAVQKAWEKYQMLLKIAGE